MIAGMADLPDPLTLKDTPLITAHTPSLDMLARRGEVVTFPSLKVNNKVTPENALLSILGYDLERGEPSLEELMQFGLNRNAAINSYSSLRPFIIPGFSGHGVCITTSAWVRGVSKCALLKPMDIYSPGSSEVEIFETIAKLTIDSILNNEFVFVYMDYPLKASLKGDYEGKVNVITSMDRHLINPIADYVWKSDLMINLVVTTDLVTPWHKKFPEDISVPAILYFNNHDWDGDPDRKFTELEAILSQRKFDNPSDLMRYLINFSVSEDDDEEEKNDKF